MSDYYKVKLSIVAPNGDEVRVIEPIAFGGWSLDEQDNEAMMRDVCNKLIERLADKGAL
jgi:hypothetical protein